MEEKTNLRPQRNKGRRYFDFDAIKVTLASPDQILAWSHGEVTKAETINYRTLKPEVDGLMCEKIFGPTVNYQCYCGKYRKVRYKGIICDKCGVEVTSNRVRRERMGHIKLAVPVTHVWFSFKIPNKIATILNLSQKKILSVIYYTRYMITEVDKARRKEIIPIIVQELDEKKAELKSESDAEVKALKDELNKKIKDLKKKEKDKSKVEFQSETLDHDYSRKTAQIHKEFADAEEELENEYHELKDLVERIDVGEVLTEDEFIKLKERNFLFFSAKMGADAVRQLLETIDLNALSKKLRKEISNTQSSAKRSKLVSRLQLISGMLENNLRPEWMVLDVLPVIPPDLRPIIQLPGGKFATSDLNDLYRRVINRNNRLKRLIQIGAPDVILRNEKRMLQEAVDALIDNSHRPGKAITNLRRMPYKALTDNLRGKKGRFRRNLLGKRVDYSGRAVIIGSAKLRLNQCGLPKSMALEMMKPFVIRELIDREEAPNIRVAKQIIDDEEAIVWDILEELIADRPVLLNRAPTLHKQGIQAFYPILIEGHAIRIHPLICAGYNADFDGDMMAVHVPLTQDAIDEAKNVMLAQYNITLQSDGSILAIPAKDMSAGIYLLTAKDEEGPVTAFPTYNRAVSSFDIGEITLNEKISININGKMVETSVGRLVLNEVLPEDFRFVNEQLDKSKMSDIIKEIVRTYPIEAAVEVLDGLKDLGFKYATEFGFDLAMEDFDIDVDRENLLAEGNEKELKLQEDYMMGLLTYEEKKQLTVEVWGDISTRMSDNIWKNVKHDSRVYEQVMSGAGKFLTQAASIISMKGLIRDPNGEWVELPIKGNFASGLSVFEYFVNSRSGRKGAADTALRTAKSGYLTRKLVDVAQDVIIRTEDCGSKGEGHTIVRDDDLVNRRVPFTDLIHGRWTAEKVVHPKTGKVIVGDDAEITSDIAAKINEAGVQSVKVRSPLSCKAPLGICAKCYGNDIGENKLVSVGKAVGVIAAQSMGEPATQMILRTFHLGGAGETDIVRGLPRLTELFEARFPKKAAFIMPFSGKVEIDEEEDGSYNVHIEGKKEEKRIYFLTGAKKISVKDGDKVKDGDVLYIAEDETERQAPFSGKIEISGNVLEITGELPAVEDLRIPSIYRVQVESGSKLEAGEQITDGNIDPKSYFEIKGMLAAQEYIIDNVQKVYTEQGISMNDKHIECIVRQMGRMSKIVDPGDTGYLVGAYVNKYMANLKNQIADEKKEKPAYYEEQLMGLTASSLRTESFLSAMSFQEQVRVLTEASLIGKVDYLRGLKENVIIGRPIPVGEAARIDDYRQLEEFDGTE